jgi:hypothetical protein
MGGCFGVPPFQFLSTTAMIEPSTIQTLLEVGLLAFLGTLAILLCE